jgi:nucleotide-binding universal stress UspA family protein
MTHRILVVANQTLAGENLAALVRARAGAGPTELWIVVPTTPLQEQSGTSVPGTGALGLGGESEPLDAHALAERRLQAAVDRFHALGVAVGGEVGNEDPFTAVEDALSRREVDEIIISTLPSGTSRWLRTDLPSRVRRQFNVPVSTVISRVSQRV